MRVRVMNYGIVRDADIEFLPGLNVIRGESGSGKSTVIRGIEGAIFNTSGDSVITQGETNAVIEIDYSSHRLKRTRSTKTSFKTTYEIDGDLLLKVGQTPVQKVLDAFGIKEIKAGTVSLRPNFLPQFAKPFLIDESPSKIFEFLTVTQNAVNLKDVETAITEDLKELQTQRKIKDETVNSLKKVILTSYQILKHEKEISTLGKDLDRFNKKEDTCSRLDSLIKTIVEKKKHVDLLNEKILYIEKVLRCIEDLHIDYEKIDGYIRKIATMESMIGKMDSLVRSNEQIKIKLENTKRIIISDDEKNKVSSMLEKHGQLEKMITSYYQKDVALNAISQEGIKLKEEAGLLDNEIKDFYDKNIPIVIMNTNDGLCTSLNVTKNTVIDILTTKW